MVIELIRGVALLLALCYLDSIVQRLPRIGDKGRVVMSGLLYGGICVVGMMAPINLAPGIIFDARSVVLSIAGLYGGPVVGVVAAVIAGGYRLWLGGAGAGVGLCVVLTSMVAGLAYRHFLESRQRRAGVVQLLVFGFIVHALSIGWFMFLPAPAVANVIDRLAVPYLIVFSLATALLGWIVADIRDRLTTERELARATRALRESEEKLRAVVEYSPNGITLKDRAGNFLIVNTTYARWQGASVADMVGKSIADFFPASEAAESVAKDRLVFDSKQVWSGEYMRQFADGNSRHLKIHKVPVALPALGVDAVLTILTDISEAKWTEAQLLRARDEAITASLAKSEFLARMSHEFRTPLNAILGFSEILKQEYFGPLGADRYRDYAKDIHISAELLLELVNDLLDIAAIEGGRIRVDVQAIDIAAAVDQCVRTIIDRLSARGIRLGVDVADGLQPLHADERAVKQILLNLLSNASKFTPKDGVIDIAIRQSDGRTRIVVSDTGVGISGEHLTELRKPFQARGSQPYRSEDGWGLGLTIVQALVELHGGDFGIESELGVGTTVSVDLPTDGNHTGNRAGA